MRSGRYPLDDQQRPIEDLDVSYATGSDRAVAAAVVVEIASGAVLEEVVRPGVVAFPYAPGMLASREVPLLLDVLGALQTTVDLLLCDGQGLAHPRRCGLACHLGVLAERPAIGCAKNHFVGEHAEPGPQRGDRADLSPGVGMVGGESDAPDPPTLYTGRMRVTGLDHIVVVSPDAERLIAWYTSVLGLEPVRLEQWRAGEVPFASLRIDATTIIDVLAGERSGTNVEHMALVVDADLDALAAEHDVAAPRNLFGAQGQGMGIYLRDPDGNGVELRTYAS